MLKLNSYSFDYEYKQNIYNYKYDYCTNIVYTYANELGNNITDV